MREIDETLQDTKQSKLFHRASRTKPRGQATRWELRYQACRASWTERQRQESFSDHCHRQGQATFGDHSHRGGRKQRLLFSRGSLGDDFPEQRPPIRGKRCKRDTTAAARNVGVYSWGASTAVSHSESAPQTATATPIPRTEGAARG